SITFTGTFSEAVTVTGTPSLNRSNCGFTLMPDIMNRQLGRVIFTDLTALLLATNLTIKLAHLPFLS
ncbi:hypothetical protein, partial [Roseobacter sp. HKCCA2468]|uniref:hypothetical protein n=1 Tax=Roseobacter sp. HKCCA2468 TaxID=3120342 RepID=UPI0030EEC421